MWLVNLLAYIFASRSCIGHAEGPRFDLCSGLAKGRPIPVGETKKSYNEKLEAERKMRRKNGEERICKTGVADLENLKEARSLLFLTEETRNDYSDEAMREVKRIYASSARIIKYMKHKKEKKK